MRLKEIVKILKGKLIGEDIEIQGVSSIEEAEKGEITFSLNGGKVKDTKASAIILKEKGEGISIPVILVDHPKLAFSKLLSIFSSIKHPCGISKKASISENVKIGDNVAIGDFAVIENGAKIEEGAIIYPNVYIGMNVTIGKGTIVYPRAVIMNAKIGDSVIIHSGVVIGSDGFGYIKDNGKNVKIPHKGGVLIKDEVEIGANTTIDRGTIKDTIIGKGTKIDNLVHIAHNCIIGKNCIIVAQVGISGSVIIGDNVVIAGQAGISDHIKIGSQTTIAARSGVTKDIPCEKIVSGFPAKDHREEKRLHGLIQRLPKLIERVKRLENLIK
ncbi:MAG: UDP-3-O-(3-hydroxymyristoyl)glucosamine N-acyltransferase [bacterium]